jgi:hypothetical protein
MRNPQPPLTRGAELTAIVSVALVSDLGPQVSTACGDRARAAVRSIGSMPVQPERLKQAANRM